MDVDCSSECTDNGLGSIVSGVIQSRKNEPRKIFLSEFVLAKLIYYFPGKWRQDAELWVSTIEGDGNSYREFIDEIPDDRDCDEEAADEMDMIDEITSITNKINGSIPERVEDPIDYRTRGLCTISKQLLTTTDIREDATGIDFPFVKTMSMISKQYEKSMLQVLENIDSLSTDLQISKMKIFVSNILHCVKMSWFANQITREMKEKIDELAISLFKTWYGVNDPKIELRSKAFVSVAAENSFRWTFKNRDLDIFSKSLILQPCEFCGTVKTSKQMRSEFSEILDKWKIGALTTSLNMALEKISILEQTIKTSGMVDDDKMVGVAVINKSPGANIASLVSSKRVMKPSIRKQTEHSKHIQSIVISDEEREVETDVDTTHVQNTSPVLAIATATTANIEIVEDIMDTCNETTTASQRDGDVFQTVVPVIGIDIREQEDGRCNDTISKSSPTQKTVVKEHRSRRKRLYSFMTNTSFKNVARVAISNAFMHVPSIYNGAGPFEKPQKERVETHMEEFIDSVFTIERLKTINSPIETSEKMMAFGVLRKSCSYIQKTIGWLHWFSLYRSTRRSGCTKHAKISIKKLLGVTKLLCEKTNSIKVYLPEHVYAMVKKLFITIKESQNNSDDD
jgi:hypothetical protein